MPALIYVRQSKDSADGIDRQVADCRALLAREGITDATVITDNDVSASSRKPRPGYDGELLPAIAAGGSDVVVVAQAQDRLMRKPREMEDLIDLVERTGARILLVRSMFDLTTAMGRASARQGAVWARLEVEQKAERQKRAELQGREEGRPPRRRSFGYLPGGMAIDPDEGPAVAEAYDAVLAGTPLTKIAAAWNAEGHRTAFGAKSKAWTGGTVRKVILNARNAGIRTYAGEELAQRGTWQAIVPEETYRQAVAVLNDPARRTSGGVTARKHLGGGLYVCGRCGSDVKSTTRSAKQGGATVYVCRARKHLTRVAAPVDAFVTDVVRARLARPDVADLVTGGSPELTELQARARALRARVRRLETDYADGEITARILREHSGRFTAELARIDARTAELTRTSRLARLAASADPVAAFDALDVTVRQAVVDALMTVTLLPALTGVRAFDPQTVRIDWRE